jgi:hypothetical protein
MGRRIIQLDEGRPASLFKVFSSEVDTGSREEHASNQK